MNMIANIDAITVRFQNICMGIRDTSANASIDLFPWDEALLRVGKNLARILATIRHTAGSREFRGSDA